MGSVKALRKRYDSALESKDFYTAEQSCRTIAHRLRGTRGLEKEKAARQARQMILDGAVALLQAKEVHSATALGVDLVSDLQTDKIMFQDGKEQLCTIVNAFGNDPLEKEQESERLRFLKACVEYSKKADLGGRLHGDEIFNLMVGESYWALKDFRSAQKHLIRSNSPQVCGVMLCDWNKRLESSTEASAPKYVLIETIVEYCLTGNIADSKIVVDVFQTREKAEWMLETPPSSQVSFSGMLVQVLQRGNAYPLFSKLRDTYSVLLGGDTVLQAKLDTLGEMYYGVKPSRGGSMQDILSEVMKGFLGGGSSDRP